MPSQSDLIPKNISLGATTVAPGASLSVSWLLANQGSAAANSASTTELRITQSNTLATGTNLLGVSTSALAAGASVSQSATLTAPTVPGTYYVWVIADNFGKVSNQSDVNNDLQHSVSFTVAAPKSDLIPTNITLGSTTVAPGAALAVDWTLLNQGSGAANASSTTEVRINQLSSSAAGTNLASVSTSALGAGASAAQHVTLTAPNAPGVYYVWVLADNFSAVTNQSNTTNDLQHSVSFTVSANHTPTAAGHDQATTPGSVIPLSALFTYADGDGAGDIVGFAVQDTTAGGGHLVRDGVAKSDNVVYGNSTFGIPISEIGLWSYVVGPAGSVDTLHFNAIDSTGDYNHTAAVAIVTADRPPTATGHDQSAAPGTAIPLSTLFTYSDPDTDIDGAIEGFAVQDVTAGGGHLVRNGVTLLDNTIYGSSAAGIPIGEIGLWSFVVGPSGSVDTLHFNAIDGSGAYNLPAANAVVTAGAGGTTADAVHQGTTSHVVLQSGFAQTGQIDAEPLSSDTSISVADGTGGYIDKDWFEVTLAKGNVYTFTGSATSITTGLMDIALYGQSGALAHGAVEGSAPSFVFDTTYQTNATQTYYLAVSAGGADPAWRTATGGYSVSFSAQASAGTADQIPATILSNASLQPGVTNGTIDASDIAGGPDDDYYRVSLSAGHSYSIVASAGVSGDDTLTTVIIRLRDAAGHSLSTGDVTATGSNPRISYTVPGSGVQDYFLAISASGAAGQTGKYSITLIDNGIAPTPPAPGDVPASTSSTTIAGFDYVTYPGAAAMSWLMQNTNLREVGYYLGKSVDNTDVPGIIQNAQVQGGHNVSNTANFTWMGARATLAAQGWRIAPIYVGEQDPTFTAINHLSYYALPSQQTGAAHGLEAAKLLQSEGFAAGTTVFLDWESGGAIDAAEAQYFVAWCSTIVGAGYAPGIYCPIGSAASIQSALSQGGIQASFWVANINAYNHTPAAYSPSGDLFPVPDLFNPDRNTGSGLASAAGWQFRGPAETTFDLYNLGTTLAAALRSATGSSHAYVDLDVFSIPASATVSSHGSQAAPLVGDNGLLSIVGASDLATNLTVAAQGAVGAITDSITGNVQYLFSQFSEISFSGGVLGDLLKVLSLDGTGIANHTVLFDGNGGDDTLDGQNADKTIVANGGDGNDTLIGGAADDALDGGPGADSLAGGAGADHLTGGGDNDLLDGGVGSDTADYSAASARVVVDLSFAGAQNIGADQGSDTLVSIENVEGSAFDDVLWDSAADNRLSGNAGNDQLIGLHGGVDSFFGGAGDDSIAPGATLTAADRVDGGDGHDTLSLQGDYSAGLTFGPDTMTGIEQLTLIGGASYRLILDDGNIAAGQRLEVNGLSLGASDRLDFSAAAETDGQVTAFGGAGADTLRGGAGSDQLIGGAGDDHLYGGDGNDILDGRDWSRAAPDGADFIDGGAGFDAVTVDLSALAQSLDIKGADAASGNGVTLANGVHLQNVESLWLTLGSGNDTFTASTAPIPDGAMLFSIHGGGGDDTLVADGHGEDGFYGDDGFDRMILDYSWATGVVQTTAYQDRYWASEGGLPPGSASPYNYIVAEGVEAVSITGGSAADILYGMAAGDILRGGAGNDQIYGGAGDDVITGGAGQDFMYGGAGADAFVVSQIGDASLAAPDAIYDFQPGVDWIDLTAFFAPGVQITTRTDGANTGVYIDIQGDGVYDYALVLANVASLAAGDLHIAPPGQTAGIAMFGSQLGDVLTGGAGDDYLFGDAGNDSLAGGAGIDDAGFGETSAGMILLRSVSGWTVTTGGGGTDSLTGVERLSFTDRNIDLTHPASADANLDFKSDVLWRNDSGELYVWNSQSGQGAFLGQTLGNPGTAWHVQAVGDYDGDGKADVLWRNNTGDLYVYRSDDGAAVTFTGQSISYVDPVWQIVPHAGDFDGDGRSDILYRNSSTGEVYLWNSNTGSDVSFVGQSLGGIPASWHIQGVDDFDADGKADVLWRNDGGDVYVWLSRGGDNAVTTQGQSISSVPNDWSIIGTGDFNGDGRADILWRHAGDGELYVWNSQTNNAAINFVGQSLGIVGLDWSVAAIGDYDGDGRADILFRNADGRVYVWNSNDTGPVGFQGQGLGQTPTDWHILSDFHGM